MLLTRLLKQKVKSESLATYFADASTLHPSAKPLTLIWIMRRLRIPFSEPIADHWPSALFPKSSIDVLVSIGLTDN